MPPEINRFSEICLPDINGGNNVSGTTHEKLIDDRLISVYRPFTIPRVLGGSPVPSDDEDEESDEDSSSEEGKAKAEEPEVDKALINRRQRGRGVQKKEGKEGEAATGGQKGGPKGRGRGVSAAEQRNRAHNERNKGMRANHNRKAGAERKRAKGMGMLSQR